MMTKARQEPRAVTPFGEALAIDAIGSDATTKLAPRSVDALLR